MTSPATAKAVPLAILDTNVIVAGLLTRDAQSPPAQLLDGLLTGRCSFLMSEALLVEYRNVLLRDRIQRVHGLSADEIDHVLTAIVTNAILREPAQRTGAPDPNDNHLWSLALASPGSVLVTGDAALIASPPPDVPVVSPRQFLDALSGPATA